MSTVRIDVNGVLDLAQRMNKCISILETEQYEMEKLLKTVDPRILARHNIRGRINGVINELVQGQDKIRQIQGVLRLAANSYAQANKTVNKMGSQFTNNINSMLKGAEDAANGFFNTIQKDISSFGTNASKFFEEDSEKIINAEKQIQTGAQSAWGNIQAAWMNTEKQIETGAQSAWGNIQAAWMNIEGMFSDKKNDSIVNNVPKPKKAESIKDALNDNRINSTVNNVPKFKEIEAFKDELKPLQEASNAPSNWTFETLEDQKIRKWEDNVDQSSMGPLMSFGAGAANGFTFGLINSSLICNTNYPNYQEYNKESSYVMDKYPVAAEIGKNVGSMPYMVVGAGEVSDTVQASTYTEKAADISYEIKDIEKVEGAVSDTSKAEKIIQDTSKTGLDEVNKEALKEAGNTEATLTNVEARQWYLEQEKSISNLIDNSQSLENRARQAFELRNQFRTQARNLMSDRDLAEKLMSEEPNLSWERVVQKANSKGYTGDDIYNYIIDSSQRSRTSVNNSLGLGD